MAPARERPSPIDRFTDASASAITSGFSAAMALGPQPKAGPSKLQRESTALNASEGTDWLRNLQQASGMVGSGSDAKNGEGAAYGISGSRLGEDDDLSEDDDGDSDADSANGGGKKKPKKGRAKAKVGKTNNDESTAAQRKAQNRIAQREFRQRKQQYIRALEARVELLSSDHDTQVDRLRYALRGLLTENNQLRSILGSFASFIGTEMIGGPLQKSGMSRNELEEIISNSSEKTMTETWQNWPGARECEALRQIRLESNLPPEGLPESQKLPEHAIANTAAANAATAAEAAKRQNGGSSTHTSPTSVDTDKRSNPKRKVTGDDSMSSKGGKRKQLSKATPEDNSVVSTNDQSSLLTSQSDSTSPVVTNIPNFYDPEQNAHLANFFYQNSLSNNFTTTAPFSPFTGNGNQQVSSSQPQDSSAILASLFGVGEVAKMGGGGFLSQQTSSSPSFPPMNMSSDSPIYMSSVRQRTVANAEEPEEIKRIGGYAATLRRDTLRFGGAKGESELTRVVEGISQLIHQMANFRRQPSYHLPSLLEPSDIQQTRPHDPFVDALPFSGLRQKLIEHQDSLIMDQVFLSLLYHTVLHSGDATVESNWEIKEGFIYSYPQLIDRQMLANANQWRSSRDESSITFESLSSLAQ